MAFHITHGAVSFQVLGDAAEEVGIDYLPEKTSNSDCFGYGNNSEASEAAGGGAAAAVAPGGGAL